MNKQLVVNVLIVFLLVGGVIGGIFAVQQATNYLSRAQEDVGQPKNLSTRVLSADQAIVSWSTDEEVISLVLYGTGPTSLVEAQTELSSAKTHMVTLTNLKAETNYYFKIQVGQQVFDENGQPWQFSTSSADSPGKLSEKECRNAYGTNDSRFDMNKDGVVNGFDCKLYLEQR
jgi:phosphodiesterase/alkaline phosphatase D-like protein